MNFHFNSFFYLALLQRTNTVESILYWIASIINKNYYFFYRNVYDAKSRPSEWMLKKNIFTFSYCCLCIRHNCKMIRQQQYAIQVAKRKETQSNCNEIRDVQNNKRNETKHKTTREWNKTKKLWEHNDTTNIAIVTSSSCT